MSAKTKNNYLADTKRILKKYFIISLLTFPLFTLAEPQHSIPQISLLFVDLSTHKILVAENPDQRLVPASVTKLFPAAAALKQWGSLYSFATPIYTRGQLTEGVLTGDLVFYGIGDPMLTNEKMWELANTLRRLGLKHVQGNIIVNNSYFGTVSIKDADRIAAKNHSMESYDGLLSSAGSNFGTVAVSVFPGANIGMPAKISLIPTSLDNVFLFSHVVTDNKNNLQFTRESKNNRELLTISGTVATAAPVTLYRSVGDPAQATAVLFKSFLQQAGIVITGMARVESTPLQPHDKLLVKLDSVPLSQSITAMLFNSNNFIADMLTLDLWRQQHPQAVPAISLAEAAQNLLISFKEMQAHSAFAAQVTTLPHLDSGSGLTPTNRLSARDVVILLDGIYKNTRDFPVLYGGLVIPGQQTEWREIKTADHPWMSRVSVKTGGLKYPVVVYSLAGYFRMKNNDIGAFAILLNQAGVEDKKMNELKVQQLKEILIKKLDDLIM